MAQTITLNVTGMTCDHCVNSVTNALKEIPGVADASVSLDANSASVTGDSIDTARLIAAIEEEGYKAAVAV